MSALLTLQEVFEQRLPQVRRDPWTPAGRMTIHYKDGRPLPWGDVEDGATDTGALEVQKCLMFMLPRDERVWEPWTGPAI